MLELNRANSFTPLRAALISALMAGAIALPSAPAKAAPKYTPHLLPQQTIIPIQHRHPWRPRRLRERRVYFENCWWGRRLRPGLPPSPWRCVSCPGLPGGRCPGR